MMMHTRIPDSDYDIERGLYQSGLLHTRRHFGSKQWRVTLTLLIIFIMLAIVGGCVTFTVLNSVEIKTGQDSVSTTTLEKKTMNPTLAIESTTTTMTKTTTTPAPIQVTMQTTPVLESTTTVTTLSPIQVEAMQTTLSPIENTVLSTSLPIVGVMMQNETLSSMK